MGIRIDDKELVELLNTSVMRKIIIDDLVDTVIHSDCLDVKLSALVLLQYNLSSFEFKVQINNLVREDPTMQLIVNSFLKEFPNE